MTLNELVKLTNALNNWAQEYGGYRDVPSWFERGRKFGCGGLGFLLLFYPVKFKYQWGNILMHSILGNIFCRQHFEIYFLLVPESRI